MRFPRGCRLLVLAALLLVVGNALAPAAVAKGKRSSCKGSKVAVKVGKKTTCRAFATVFPSPKAVDIRLAYLQQALKFDPASAVKGKKRQRVKTLQSGFGAAGKRAQRKLLEVLPKALAFIDREGGGASSSSSFPPGPALASAGCQPGPAGPTGSTDGATLGLLGDNGGYMDVPIGGGLRVKLTFVSCGGVTAFNIPECPTANGLVDGKGRGEFRVTFEIRGRNEVVSRNSTVLEEKAKIRGEVGPDAKLKSIDVEHTEEAFIVASGGIVIRGGVTRKVHIPMPEGHYDPAGASVRFFGDALAPNSGADSFASTAQAAITGFRAAEGRWSTFTPSGPYCAEPIFNPDSNALKLKKGDKKQLSIYAKARADGGRATGAKWMLLGPLNADFTPMASQDASPTIQYTVSNSPAGDQVKVTVKFTSTAGVGEKTWTEPVVPSGINHITGTFSGEFKGAPSVEGRTVQTWSGTVDLNRLATIEGADYYTLISGNVLITASGLDGSGISGCQQTGSNSAKLTGGSVEVTPEGPEGGAPYDYSIDVSMPFEALNITRVDCNKASQEAGFEGTEYPLTPAYRFSTQGQESLDGITFTGTEDESFGEVIDIQHWDLHGAE